MWQAYLCLHSAEICSHLGLLVIHDFSFRFDTFDGEQTSTAANCLITQNQATKGTVTVLM